MIIANKIKVFKKPFYLSFFYEYSKINYYQSLDIDPGASNQEIKNKYYSLAKKYHPDIAKDQISKKKFILIQQAYQTLGNETKRKQYDNTYYSQTYGKYNQESKQNYSYQQPKSQYHNYYKYQESNFDNPSFFKLILDNKFKILRYGFLLYFLFQILDYFRFKNHFLDIERRQQLMIEHNPHIIQRRKKMYKQEMEKKNIYGQIRHVNMRRLEDQGQKAKKAKIQSLISIKGIQKVQEPQNLIHIKSQYI